MNYISHYYCLKEKNPYYTLGVFLPDILKNFSFLYNRYFRSYVPTSLNTFELMLWRGIIQHYQDDAYFHDLSFFKLGMQQIEEAMNLSDALILLKRKFLISHVLYELILDNMILDRHPSLELEIYDDLAKIDITILRNFLRNIVGENEEIELYLYSLECFLARRFLGFYSMESNLVKSLHMVTGKISQWDLNDSIVNEFANIIKVQKQKIDFDMLFDSVKQYRVIA